MTRAEMRRAAADLVASWPAFDEATKADLAVLLRPAVATVRATQKAEPARLVRRAA